MENKKTVLYVKYFGKKAGLLYNRVENHRK